MGQDCADGLNFPIQVSATLRVIKHPTNDPTGTAVEDRTRIFEFGPRGGGQGGDHPNPAKGFTLPFKLLELP